MTSVLMREETQGECHVVREAETGVIQMQTRMPRIGIDHHMLGRGKEDSTVSLQGSMALPTH